MKNIEHRTSNAERRILTGARRAARAYRFLTVAALLLAAVQTYGYPGAPASQLQVNQGTQPYLWVTPATLAGKTNLSAATAVSVPQTLALVNQYPPQIFVSTNGDALAPANIGGLYQFAFTNATLGGYALYQHVPQTTNIAVITAGGSGNPGNFSIVGWNICPSNELAAGSVSFDYYNPNGLMLPLSGNWPDGDAIYTGHITVVATNSPPINFAFPSSQFLMPYMAQRVGQRFIQNFWNHQVTKFVFMWDSYSVDPFSSAYPYPRFLINDWYQMEYNWSFPGSGKSTLPGLQAAGYWGVFPNYFVDNSEINPPAFPLSSYAPIIATWWGVHNNQTESWGMFTNCNNVMISWIQTPSGNASLVIETNSPGGATATFVTLNGLSAAGTTNALATNFALPLGTYNFTATTAAAAQTNYLWAITAWNTTNGCVAFEIANGGITLPQFQQSMPYITNTLAAISPDVTFVFNKHTFSDNPYSQQTNLMNMYQTVNGSYTNSATSIWAWLGSAEVSSAGTADSGSYINQIYWQMCVQNGWTYLDTHFPFGAGTNMLLEPTLVHPTLIGQALGGAQIEEQCGLPVSYPEEAFMNAYNQVFFDSFRTNYNPSSWGTATIPQGCYGLRASNDVLYLVAPWNLAGTNKIGNLAP